jgi:protease-4
VFLSRKKVAVIQLFGTLGGGIKSQAYDRIFTTVMRDRGIRALVLDVDSPGGSAPVSDHFYRRVAAVAQRKPVVASIRNVGASGAYLVCCGAHRILATHGAVVGSIGVISIRPVVEGLLEKLGIAVNVNKGGALKDMGAFWRKPTPDEEKRLQAFVDDYYQVFVSTVAKARRLDEAKARELATGEVFWAPRAKELGLIDGLGDLDQAIDMAAEAAKIPRRRVVQLAPRRGWRERLFGPFAESLVESVSSEIERRIWLNSLRY